jgi:hypothetical protein
MKGRSMNTKILSVAVIAGLTCASAADAATLFKSSVNDSTGGAWGFVTNEPDWGGMSKTATNRPTSQTYPAVGDNTQVAMFGPGHHAAAANDWSTPTTHAYPLFKFHLAGLYGTNNRATTDATLNLQVYWNHFNTGFGNTRISDTANPNWGHGTDNTAWIANSLALYQIPAGKLAGANSTTPATVVTALKGASYNSLTSNGTDNWLPVRGSMSAVSTWNGVSNLQFTIPQATINAWLDDPSTYNGLTLANTTPDEQFLNGAIVFTADQNANTLSFSYAPVPEPTCMSLMLIVGVEFKGPAAPVVAST